MSVNVSSAGNGMKINAITAKRFFFRYHKNEANPNPGIPNSMGKLIIVDQGVNKPIQHLVLKAEIFDSLKTMVQYANLTFVGIAALPATNDEGSDTLILVAIAENSEKEQFYFLPPDVTDLNYIYDHVQTCPTYCNHIVNNHKVWGSWIQ